MPSAITFSLLSDHFRTIAGTLTTPASYRFGSPSEILGSPSLDFPLMLLSSREISNPPPQLTDTDEEPASSLDGTELMTGQAHETHHVRLSLYSLYNMAEQSAATLDQKYDAVQAQLMEFIYKAFSLAYAPDYSIEGGAANVGIYRRRYDESSNLVSVEARFKVKVFAGTGGYSGFIADYTKEFYTIDFQPGGLSYAYIFVREFSSVSFELLTTVTGESEFSSVTFSKNNSPLPLPFTASRGDFVKVALNGWSGNAVQIRVTASKQPYSESGRAVKPGGDARYIFVWNNASLTLSRIDTGAGDTVSTLSSFGFTPDAQAGLVFNPDDGLIYFFASSTKIVAIDPIAFTIARTVTIPAQGSGGWGGCYDPLRKLILFHRSYGAFLFDPVADVVTSSFSFSSRDGAGYLAPIDAYVSFDFNMLPGFYEAASLTESIVPVNNIGNFAGCFYLPASNYLYVSTSGSIKVVNMAPGLPVIAAVSIAGGRAGAAYVPATGMGYFPAYNSGTVEVLNTTTNLIASSFNLTLLGGETGIADCLYSEYTSYLYFLPYGSSVSRIIVVDPATNSVVKTIAVGTSAALEFKWQTALIKNRLIYHG